MFFIGFFVFRFFDLSLPSNFVKFNLLKINPL